VNLPNAITIGRFLLVPVVVWAIASGQMLFAFWLFVAAAVSDSVDGFLAKQLGMTSDFGAYLDPLADKAMLMSIYISLSIAGLLPLWIVIAVVSRDVMILGAIVVSSIVVCASMVGSAPLKAGVRTVPSEPAARPKPTASASAATLPRM